MIPRFVLAFVPVASIAFAAVSPTPELATDGDALGNALRLMAYGLVAVFGAAFLISAHLYVATGRDTPSVARRVRRRAL